MPANKEQEIWNRDAFAAYVQSERERFYRIAFSYVRDSDTALDIVQQAIYRALRSLNTLQEPRYAGTWFYKILINTCIDECRRMQRWVPTDPVEFAALPDLQASERDRIMDLQRAVDALEPEEKSIIVLRYFEDLKLRDIASILDMNVSTVKNKLYKTLADLKVELKGEEEKE